MGWAMAFSPCCVCERCFGYNPRAVPSTSAVTGTKEPVCEPCMDRVNERRRSLGIEPVTIMRDAYAPVDEDDL
jgi:hypothetical protein